MIQVNFDFTDETFREVLRQEIKEAVSQAIKHNELPPFLTKRQMMDLLHIKDSKAALLMARPDFPVCKEAGTLIPTHLLFKWVERNTRWVELNTNYFDNVI